MSTAAHPRCAMQAPDFTVFPPWVESSKSDLANESISSYSSLTSIEIIWKSPFSPVVAPLQFDQLAPLAAMFPSLDNLL